MGRHTSQGRELGELTSKPTQSDKPPIQLDDFEVGESHENVKEQVKELLNEFRQIIALPGEKPGVTSVRTHKIRLEDVTLVYRVSTPV